METYPIAAGTALNLRLNLLDGQGNPQTYPAPGPALQAEVWPGGSRQESFAVAASWADPTTGLVNLSVLASQTATLATGTYQGRLVIADPDLGSVVGYEWLLAVQGSPGATLERPVYCSYQDMLKHGRSWLPALFEQEIDLAGFADQRADARAWLEELIIEAQPNRTGRGFGLPWGGWFSTTSYLRSQLDANRLIVRPWVVEATARKALALVCEGQIGVGEQGQDYAKLGRWQAAEARRIALARHAEIADQNGVLLYRINLASGSFC